MRNAFSKAIFELSKKNKDCALLVGDIGNRLFDDFKSENPDRFVNCGISEANMTGVAAGMAMNGFKPFTYTIAPFNTYRCLEQIKINLSLEVKPLGHSSLQNNKRNEIWNNLTPFLETLH